MRHEGYNQLSLQLDVRLRKQARRTRRLPFPLVELARSAEGAFGSDPQAALYALLSGLRAVYRNPRNQSPRRLEGIIEELTGEVLAWLDQTPHTLSSTRGWCVRILKNPFDTPAVAFARTLNNKLLHSGAHGAAV